NTASQSENNRRLNRRKWCIRLKLSHNHGLSSNDLSQTPVNMHFSLWRIAISAVLVYETVNSNPLTFSDREGTLHESAVGRPEHAQLLHTTSVLDAPAPRHAAGRVARLPRANRPDGLRRWP